MLLSKKIYLISKMNFFPSIITTVYFRFAKTSDCQGVEIMFTYYGAKLLPHWLTIISFFPETLNPEKYQKLLPECDNDGRLFLLYQQELRQKDWIERNAFSGIINTENDEDVFIYEKRRSLLIYR